MSYSVIVITICFFVAGAILMALARWFRPSPGSRHRNPDTVKYLVYVIIVAVLLFSASVGRWLVGLCLVGIAVAGTIELYRSLTSYHPALAASSIVIGLVTALGLGHLIVIGDKQTWLGQFIFVYLLVCITDSYAQLWGRLIGRHRLCPRLSPEKTVEGLLGGVMTTLLAAWLYRPLMPGTSKTTLIVIAITIAMAAILGDLAFSWLKRRLGLKDFSAVLPGHGGVLDRFDSLILAAPAFYWTEQMLT